MLLPAGTFSGVDGRGPYHLPNPEAVIAASMPKGAPLVFDRDHATDHSLKSGINAPAQGWIRSLQAIDGAIWGEVDWNDEGRALLTSRAYRNISPVFNHRADGHITKLLRVSLTNAPNLDLPALHSQEPHRMDFLPAIRAALGLPETADQPAIITAATAARTAVAAHAQQLKSIAAAAKLDPAAGADMIVTALQSRTAGAGTLEEVTALQSRIVELENGVKREKAEAAIDAAIRAGKPILQTRREEFIARHMQDPAGTVAWLADMPSLHSGGVPGGPAPRVAVDGIDGSDAQMIALMGLDPDAFKKTKEAIAKGVSA